MASKNYRVRFVFSLDKDTEAEAKKWFERYFENTLFKHYMLRAYDLNVEYECEDDNPFYNDDGYYATNTGDDK